MLDILAFGAHPDDIECGIGGTLLLAKQKNLLVGMIILTEGEAGKRNNGTDRKLEQIASAHLLGADYLEIFNFGDSKLENSLPNATIIAEKIDELQPKIILYLNENDFHPDHIVAAQLVERAVFLAHFDGHLLCYSLNYKQPLPPDIVIDISSVCEQKDQLLRAHASQYAMLQMQATLDSSCGILARSKSAEKLVSKYPLRLVNLDRLI